MHVPSRWHAFRAPSPHRDQSSQVQCDFETSIGKDDLQRSVSASEKYHLSRLIVFSFNIISFPFFISLSNAKSAESSHRDSPSFSRATVIKKCIWRTKKVRKTKERKSKSLSRARQQLLRSAQSLEPHRFYCLATSVHCSCLRAERQRHALLYIAPLFINDIAKTMNFCFLNTCSTYVRIVFFVVSF